jgi:thiol:disulfide interchange protein/DsbC/DsbD-like thiol-disulfide interchange protein
MIRKLLVLLLVIAGTFAVRASDKIDAPTDGASMIVTQPHVAAELIPESTSMQAGKPFDIALHLHMDPDWHTYWINPGDAGLATMIKWTLPEGFTAGPIQWPTPEKHNMGPLVTYGYGGDVYLLTTITPPKGDLPQHFDITAKASWLVCKEECIPGKADLTVSLDSGFMNLRMPKENTELFTAARARIPVENTQFDVTASYGQSMGGGDKQFPSMTIKLKPKSGAALATIGHALFFPEQPNVLATIKHPGGLDFYEKNGALTFIPDLQQNGDKPDKLSGVVVSDVPLIGDAKAVRLAEFPVTDGKASGAPETTNSSSSSPTTAATAGSSTTSANATTSAGSAPDAAATAQPLLIAVLGAAFIGGLILNLMPCVLPVLSLKVFSLIKHAGDNPRSAWIQGVAFTAGVVLSFWILAGALLALRATGNHLGWGFQMQSPGFVLGLTLLFFLIGLNLFGVFEVGTSLVGLDAKAAGQGSGTTSSFFNGALATLAATPCTAPFMGSALGFAAQQPAFVSMLIFTFLALGMATPYLLLTLFPGTLRFVPKPGAWMEAFKQFMGFLLMATVIFLVYVATSLVGAEETPIILFVLLLTALAAWIYGRWGTAGHSTTGRVVAAVLVILLAVCVLSQAFAITKATPETSDAVTGSKGSESWQPWSTGAVDASLAQGKPVFVDFTAAWCLSCKVNERVALDTGDVKKAFAQKDVTLLRGDWTRSDPEISKTLQQYHRDGVPLYLLYSPKDKDAPQVLPEVLTPGIVLDALNKI